MKKKNTILLSIVVCIFIIILYAIISKWFVTGKYSIILEKNDYSFEKTFTDAESELVSEGYIPYVIEYTICNPSFINFEYSYIFEVKDNNYVIIQNDEISPFTSGVKSCSNETFRSKIFINKDLTEQEIILGLKNRNINGCLLYYSMFSGNEKKISILFENQ